MQDVSASAPDALAPLEELALEEAVIGGTPWASRKVRDDRQNPDGFPALLAIDTSHEPTGTIKAGRQRAATEALTEAGRAVGVFPFLMPSTRTGEARVVGLPAPADDLTRPWSMVSLDGTDRV